MGLLRAECENCGADDFREIEKKFLGKHSDFTLFVQAFIASVSWSIRVCLVLGSEFQFFYSFRCKTRREHAINQGCLVFFLSTSWIQNTLNCHGFVIVQLRVLLLTILKNSIRKFSLLGTLLQDECIIRHCALNSLNMRYLSLNCSCQSTQMSCCIMVYMHVGRQVENCSSTVSFQKHV